MGGYFTVEKAGLAEIVEKRSRFLAEAQHVEREEEALSFLERAGRAHPKANHHVYAYLLREGARTRYSDDGEPQKTAGLPVLEVIKGAGLTDTMVVVTRYFGGTLLGTGGLVRAYTAAAQKALLAAGVREVRSYVELSLRLPYSVHDMAVKCVEKRNAKRIKIDYGSEVALSFCIPVGEESALIQELQALSRGRRISRGDPFFASL